MRKNIIRIILFSLVLKLIYYFFSLAVSFFNPDFENGLSGQSFLNLFKRNDSYWYQKAAEEGYPRVSDVRELGYSSGKEFHQSVWAHFPLYPLAVRCVESLSGTGFECSAFIISLIFGITAFCGFFLLCLRVFELDERKSMLYTLFFMLFPFHYYYSAYYTEALYFTLLAFSFIGLKTRKYWLTSLMLAPLTLVRPNGIVVLIPLFFYYFELRGGFRAALRDIKTRNTRGLCQLFWFATAPIALAAYCIYQHSMTGYYFAFIKAQAGWYKEFMFPLLALFRQGDLPTQFNSVYTIMAMLVAIAAWRRLPLSMNLFVWISILLPMSTGSVTSMPRYLSVVFPLTVFIAGPATNGRPALALSVTFALQLLSFYPWIISHPFSF